MSRDRETIDAISAAAMAIIDMLCLGACSMDVVVASCVAAAMGMDPDRAVKEAVEAGNIFIAIPPSAGLREAAESARREGLEPAMRDAAEALRRGRVAEAARAQAEAMRLLERMREAAQPNEAARQAVLRRAAADLLARVRELVERQGGLIDRTRAGGGETELASALRALRAATLSASEAARELESRVDPGAAASPLLTEAGRLQGEATVSIATSDRDGSVSHQRDSLESLQSAASRLAARREAAADDEAEAERRAWAERYRELASAQQATAEATASAAEAGAGRVAWLKLATRQAALREPTATLGEQAGADSPVVALLHEQLDRWMEQSTVRLRAGEGGEATRSVQLETAARLLAMAESYEQPRVEQPFARSPRSGGGEGGGAAGGGEAPRTPPLQELRLLRSAQASLMDRWSAGAAGVGQALSEEQLELAEAARELAARMAGDGSSGGEGEAPGAEGDGGDL